ncbi:hypothetical protein SBF1_3650002 [Candidatus Desulfosporosinus infrequens]|uniref:Uncharacterized protein n=1 Tax=Candidatus Desulfosporosinus infrequens TaxID=2043169 RepID=A0A2U3L3Z7_9FIRM|nr:hypothetical protein SBF1_3650002 [Candidatus Desulfosporosinus infrequens]
MEHMVLFFYMGIVIVMIIVAIVIGRRPGSHLNHGSSDDSKEHPDGPADHNTSSDSSPRD